MAKGLYKHMEDNPHLEQQDEKTNTIRLNKVDENDKIVQVKKSSAPSTRCEISYNKRKDKVIDVLPDTGATRSVVSSDVIEGMGLIDKLVQSKL